MRAKTMAAPPTCGHSAPGSGRSMGIETALHGWRPVAQGPEGVILSDVPEHGPRRPPRALWIGLQFNRCGSTAATLGRCAPDRLSNPGRTLPPCFG